MKFKILVIIVLVIVVIFVLGVCGNGNGVKELNDIVKEVKEDMIIIFWYVMNGV